MKTKTRLSIMLTGLAVALASSQFVMADRDDDDDRSDKRSEKVTVYFTRHAEKMREQMVVETNGLAVTYMDICGETKCSEVLNPEGELRATLLADYFDRKGITEELTHAFSSHKQRTRQTVEQIAERAGLSDQGDAIDDGVQQLPNFLDTGELATELAPEGTGISEQLTVDALLALPAGSVAVVAGHSGTIYDIFELLNINTDDPFDFPKDGEKVADFGDLWKIQIRDGEAKFKSRINLQPTKLKKVD